MGKTLKNIAKISQADETTTPAQTAPTVKLMSFDDYEKAINETTTISDLVSIWHKSGLAYVNRLEIAATTAAGVFFHRLWDLYNEAKRSGNPVKQEKLADEIGVTQSYLSKVFQTFDDNENALDRIRKGEITLQGKERVSGKKSATADRKIRPVMERFKETAVSLNKLLLKMNPDEKKEAIEIAKKVMVSVFGNYEPDSVTKSKTDEPPVDEKPVITETGNILVIPAIQTAPTQAQAATA